MTGESCSISTLPNSILIHLKRSDITDFEGGKTHCIQLGIIGRDYGKHTTDALARYIPTLTKLFEMGKLVASPYVEVGNGGFDAVLEALAYQKSGSAGSKKVVVKVQDK